MRNALVFLLIALCRTAFGQAEPLTLSQAVAVALERNPQRKAAMAEIRGARAGVREAQSGYLPRLGFSETAVRSNDPVFVFGTKLRQDRFTSADFALNRLNTPTPVGNFATRFSAQWNLFNSFATSFQVRQASRFETAAKERASRSDQLVTFRVIQAYYGVLLAARQLQVAEHAVATAQSVMEQGRARFESGSTVESDYLAAQADLAARQQELVQARNALALSKAELNIAMGIVPDHDYQTSDQTALPDWPTPALSDAEARALKERPDLKEAAAQVDARDFGVRAAKSAFGPKLNAFASSELDNVTPFGNGGNNWTAGAELQIDIFSGGEKSARLSRERAGLEQAQALKQLAEDKVRLDVRRAWYAYDTARQTAKVTEAAATQAEEALRIVNNRYQAGLTTITEMLRAEDAARTARNNHWEAIYRCRTTYAALQLAMGELNSQSPVVTS